MSGQTDGAKCRVRRVNEWAKTWNSKSSSWVGTAKDAARAWAAECECRECQARRG